MSSTLAWIASVPAFNNLRGSYPLPIWSFPSSMYLRVAAANSNCNSVLTFTLDTPKEIAFLTCSTGIPDPPCNTVYHLY